MPRKETLYWLRRKTGRADLAGPLIDAGNPEFAKRVRGYQSQLSLPAEARERRAEWCATTSPQVPS